jgi:beta-1,4-mannosyltransferase
MWLSNEMYPRLLSACDVGVSLHTSSSGLDLPMKVLDMFGVGVPVLAVAFPCLGELVVEGANGHAFATSDELARHLHRLLVAEPHALGALRASLAIDNVARGRWHEQWCARAAPLFE